MNQSVTGKFISTKRNEKNLTQGQLAKQLGVSSKTVAKWEAGKCLPDSAVVERLCEALGVSVADLLNGAATGDDGGGRHGEGWMIALLGRAQALERQRNGLWGALLLVTGLAMQSLSHAIGGFAFADFVSGALQGLSVGALLACACVVSRFWAGK